MTTTTKTTDWTTLWTGGRIAALGAIMALWFAAAYAVGTGGVLPTGPQYPIPPIAITAVIPVVLFFAIYTLSSRFRGFVLSQNIRTLTMIQHWRIIGFVFLALYAHNVLPGLFAWPAGLGDVLVGLAAFFIVARIDRDPDFVTSTAFVRYHLLGLLDFVGAIITSGLASGAFPALVSGGITAAPMDVWPLNLFPSLIVPAFMIIQISTLLQVRHLRRSAPGHAGASLQAA